MNPTNGNGITLESDELNLLRYNKQDAYAYRFRRYQDWTETYELYRDKVLTNRLTQRQSVNVPLMKQTVLVILKDIDDMPVLHFQNLDQDEQAEIFLNEYWKYTSEQNQLVLQDIIDKKQVILFGRSFDQWQIVDGKIKMTVQDTNDIMVSRYTNPNDIHSSRYLIHLHIFEPLSRLALNKDYDQEAIARLEKYYATTPGLRKAADNQRFFVQRQQKMADLGVLDAFSPLGGEAVVELALHFVKRKEKGDEEEQIYVYVEADNLEILMKKKLEDLIGVTQDHYWRDHYPYVSWTSDIERQDFYSDGAGDVVRTPNKVLNSWISQIVENRTLRNFSMKYYNSSLEGFNPSTFTPGAFEWYPLPVPDGMKIQDVIQDVEVPELTNAFNEMDYLQKMSDTAAGASPLQQGVPLPGRVQLGQAKMVLDQSLQRVKGMSKFYTQAWKDRGMMFLKLVEAGGDKLDAVKVSKEGRINSSNIYTREIAPKDWQSKLGYSCRVWAQDEKDKQDMKDIQQLQQAVMSIPNNPKLTDLYQRKILESTSLNPEDITAIMEYEKERQAAMLAAQGGMTPPAGVPTGQSAQPGMPGMQPQGAIVGQPVNALPQ